MVLGGYDDVLHPGILGEAHPGLRVVIHRVEFSGVLLVFAHRDTTIVHDPFADIFYLLALMSAGRHRVDTPVDEQSEARFPPPSHPLVAIVSAFVMVGAIV